MAARSPYDPTLEAAGRLAAELVLPGSTWIHRRVQSLRYLEPDLLEVRLSIDFTVPSDGRLSHLPLTMLPKWPPLFRFDYRDITGTPVPLLTTNENGSADRGVLLSLTDRTKPALLEDDDYLDALLTLAEGPETHLESAYETVRTKLLTTVTPERDRLIDIAAALVDSTLLWYPVADAERGHRRIAKLRYRIPNLDVLDWPRKVARSLACSPNRCLCCTSGQMRIST